MKKKILIFDDDESIAEVLSIVLEDAGYATLKATDEKTALKLLRKKPSLVLLDILLSGTDTKQFFNKLKSVRSTKNIPVIIVSANNATKKTSQALGAEDFITKPFEISEVLKKIKKHLI